MGIFIKSNISDKSNELIKPIARLMLRPLEATLSLTNPPLGVTHLQRWERWSLTLRKVC